MPVHMQNGWAGGMGLWAGVSLWAFLQSINAAAKDFQWHRITEGRLQQQLWKIFCRKLWEKLLLCLEFLRITFHTGISLSRNTYHFREYSSWGNSGGCGVGLTSEFTCTTTNAMTLGLHRGQTICCMLLHIGSSNVWFGLSRLVGNLFGKYWKKVKKKSRTLKGLKFDLFCIHSK